MIDHVSIGVRDLDQATRFYQAVLGAVGYTKLEGPPGDRRFRQDVPGVLDQLASHHGARRQRLRLACGAARAHD
jgi:catechol 2,3-dioxygenase-like lactoylglutathione lyase family enzyme